jgi:hypothetical protein
MSDFKAAQLVRARAKELELKQKRLATEAERAEKQRMVEEQRVEVARMRAEKSQANKTRLSSSSKPQAEEKKDIFSFSFLGNPKATFEEANAPEPKQSFSFFGNPKAETDPSKNIPISSRWNIPILSRWTQNANGSLTGWISNSSNYEDNTKITTSSVPKARRGTVVTTKSGSQYRLQ